MPHGKLEVVDAPALDFLEEGKFVANVGERGGVMVKCLLVGDCESWHVAVAAPLQVVRHQLEDQPVRDETNHHTERDGNETKNNRHSPQYWSLGILGVRWRRVDLESGSSDKDDQDLATAHERANDEEDLVLGDAFKDVEFVVKTSVTKKKEGYELANVFVQR